MRALKSYTVNGHLAHRCHSVRVLQTPSEDPSSDAFRRSILRLRPSTKCDPPCLSSSSYCSLPGLPGAKCSLSEPYGDSTALHAMCSLCQVPGGDTSCEGALRRADRENPIGPILFHQLDRNTTPRASIGIDGVLDPPALNFQPSRKRNS